VPKQQKVLLALVEAVTQKSY